SVYLSKFTVLAILLFLSSTLLMLFTLSYGLFLGLGEPVPYLELAKYSYFPALA
ncbi:MAG TPA: permease, partial [Lysinibacillus sp.]|nr:permease [Lysinibacillus sp.]